jgi:predicted polyphosphate/ATP-dependent NAD kinase
MTEFRVLVCGGRDYGRKWTGTQWDEDERQIDRLFAVLDKALQAATLAGKSFTLVHGGARGADSLSGLWATTRQVSDVRVYEADWKTHGKRAGPIRNIKMLDEEKPHVVIAFPGGAGTANMIKLAKDKGIPVLHVKD